MTLPSPPSMAECVLYIRTHRPIFYAFSIISSAIILCGNAIFIYMHPDIWAYGVFQAIVSLGLILSITVGVSAADFKISDHLILVKKWFGASSVKSVDVFLPVCGEPLEVLRNTWIHVATLAAFHQGQIHVYVLDDGKSDAVKKMAEQFKFGYIRRNDNTLKKAGNLRNAFKQTTGEFIIIFDADFCPRREFIVETLAYMLEYPDISILQTPQFFSDDDQPSKVAKGASQVQEFFYRLVQVSRDHHKAAICVGTNAVYRRKALEPFGGTAPINYSEDVHTGFMTMSHGWRVKYIPINLASGICPDTWGSYFTQQYRWAMGSITLCLSKHFWKQKLTKMQRISYLTGIFYYVSTGLGVIFYPVPALYLLYLHPEIIQWFHLLFAVPSFLFSTAFMAIWQTQPFTIHQLRAKLIASFAHLFAMRDYATNTVDQWRSTGSGQFSARFSGFKTLFIGYVVVVYGLIIGQSLVLVSDGFDAQNFILLWAFTAFNLAVSLGPWMEFFEGG